MIEFGSEICQNVRESSSREWLETNGIGGFASATIAGINTRRYHGLLVAAATPPTGRSVLLAKLEETVRVGDQIFELSANAYPGSIHPQGFRFLQQFKLAPFPVWCYEVAGIKIEKTVFMVNGENTTIVDYKFQIPDNFDSEIVFELRPLVTFRDYHHLRKTKNDFDAAAFEETKNSIALRPDAKLPVLNLAFEDAEIIHNGDWYRNFEYQVERERGFDFREDLFQPFVLRFDAAANKRISIVASTETRHASEAGMYRQVELSRREKLIDKAGFDDSFLQQLVADADEFIVSRGTQKSVIAGYHWFSDWGRDTMIALPGLTLTTNRPDVCKSVLLEFARHISQGMLPNRFPDAGDEPEYNTVDASLWYFEAVRALLEKTGDYAFVEKHLYEKLVEIIDCHLRGTRYQIHVDFDGLLWAGEAGTQLTWMDAKFGDQVFTPRIGKPVEIQALWYNALRVMQDLAEKFYDEARQMQYASISDLARRSFKQQFWNETEDCLYDCIGTDFKDGAVRPNQIFAVSLHYPLVKSPQKMQKIVRKVEQELLTPVGLRSLSPKDKNYRGRYEGNGFERDSAYHQGTVWAWLIGGFLTAYARSFADAPDTPEKLSGWINNFKNHLGEAGVGQFSEIFDGDAPHTPRGCIAQAWSVSEILRAAAEIKK